MMVPLNFVFLSKYHSVRDFSVAKWVVPNLYLYRATEISYLDMFKSVIRALVCLKQDKNIKKYHFTFGLVLCDYCSYENVAIFSCVFVCCVYVNLSHKIEIALF